MSTPLVSRTGPSWRAVALTIAGITIGAIVREVRFHFEDVLPDEAWTGCIVGRTRLDPPNDNYQVVAGPMTSGVAFAGRFVTRKDTSITNAAVNNREYGYWARCTPSTINTGLILYGVAVRYTAG
jgi:hypothetical protein